jgi:hypothetical protein
MASREATAPDVTKVVTIAKIARTPKLNGRRNLIRNN